jgi:hypothetical protein
MPRPNKITNMFKPAPAVEAGTIKYDNPRQNIDPAIVTQDVTAKNILFDSSNHIKFNGADIRLTTPTLFVGGDVDILNGFLEVNGVVINPITTWTHGDTNATAAGGNIFRMPVEGRAVTVSTITDGISGQIITLIGNGCNYTFNETGNIILGGLGTTRVLRTNDILQLVYEGSNWLEIGWNNL